MSETPQPEIARYRDLRFSARGHLDTFIPGHERTIAAVIGAGVMEDPEHRPAIIGADGFHVVYARVKPGHGNALHDHPSVEVFIPLDGRWEIRWGPNAEEGVILEAWDTIRIPPGVLRQYKNVGESEACILAILGGQDAGKVTWAPGVIEAAAARGAVLDAAGNVRVAAR